jgi:hypothetical protein
LGWVPSRVATLVFALIAVPAVLACSTVSDYVILNRTDDRIALLPGAILEPCSETPFTRAALENAAALWRAARGDPSWIPANAEEYQMPMFTKALPPGPQMVIVLSPVGAEIHEGGIASDRIPPCGGNAPGFGA